MVSSRCPICNAPHRLLTGSPVQVLKRTARVLAGIVSRTRRQLRVRRPKPGEWSPVEIIAHLAEHDLNHVNQIRQNLQQLAHRR